MRLDAMLIDQPADHLSRAVSAVAHEPGRIDVEALHRTFDHAFGGEDLGLSWLPTRSGCKRLSSAKASPDSTSQRDGLELSTQDRRREGVGRRPSPQQRAV